MLDVSLRESPVLQQMRTEIEAHPMGKFSTGPEVAQLLAFLIKLTGAQRVLELGTFMGYSSTVMALALPTNGNMLCCDTSQEWTDHARQYWQQFSVSDKLTLQLAPALETLDGLITEGRQFDFIYIDADKPNYPEYYEKSLQVLHQGGVMVLDNVFRGGSVINLDETNSTTKNIDALNKKIHRDKRVDLSMLPVCDGVTIIRKC
tara:strand:- start:30659 stop:31270 length:612 start_codon:yes stop_codon:yes gene_type:complete